MSDPVKHPDHYTWHPVAECHEIAQEFPYNLGAALAYIWRCGRKGAKKDAIRDMRKAIQHLEFEIERLE